MAAEWIKMRVGLSTHPKVLKIARIVSDTPFGKQLAVAFAGPAQEALLHAVTRDVTLACLLRVWSAANEHTSDGILQSSTLSTIDQIAGVAGFGNAMVAAGWAKFNARNKTVTLPNFNENNVPAKANARSTNAERQARYRERQKLQRDEAALRDRNVTHNVTRDVTSNAREEKNIKTSRVRAGARVDSVDNSSINGKHAGIRSPRKATPGKWWTDPVKIKAKGNELGMAALPGEKNKAYVSRLFNEINRRKTEP